MPSVIEVSNLREVCTGHLRYSYDTGLITLRPHAECDDEPDDRFPFAMGDACACPGEYLEEHDAIEFHVRDGGSDPYGDRNAAEVAWTSAQGDYRNW